MSAPQGRPTSAPPGTTAVPLLFTQSDSFVELLQQLGASLWITTYQAQQLLVVRATEGGLSMLVRTFDKPMGLAVDARRLALCTRDRVWFFRNAPDIAAQLEPRGRHDACYLPRTCHVTGDIAGHELAWASPHPQPLSPEGRGAEGELWVVNTRFSCLCALDPAYSFVPRWRPPFITALAAEDRCHLNGLALGTSGTAETSGTAVPAVEHFTAGTAVPPRNATTAPRYATTLGTTDTAQGWRPNKAGGGCLLALPGGEVVASGLSMPHSPRLHDGRLWLLESGTGGLLSMDPSNACLDRVAELPGFTRGLALHGPLAFVGLSKIRETSSFGGLPLAARRAELKCGVAVVDVRHGRFVASLEFQTAVEEIFDVRLLPGVCFPEVIGFQKDTVQHTFVIPP